MNCPNCGNELGENETVCPNCGTNVNETQKPAQQTAVQPTKSNKLALVGFILSFFSSIVGLILSAIGLKKCKEGYDKKNLAIAGIVISAVKIALYFILGIALAGTLAAFFSQLINSASVAML